MAVRVAAIRSCDEYRSLVSEYEAIPPQKIGLEQAAQLRQRLSQRCSDILDKQLPIGTPKPQVV